MRSVLLLLALLALLAAAALTQQPPAQPSEPVRIEKVRENLYFIRGPASVGADGLPHEPGDVALRVTPEGIIMIDDKFQRNVPEILERIRTVTSQPIKYILNTHSHADHAGGDAVLSNGIEIIAQHNVRENMLRNKQAGAPRIVFNDEAEVSLGGITVEAHYLGRGHTNGDSVIYFRDLRVIHAGDLCIDGMPFIDYDNGGSALEWVKTLDNVLKIDFDIAIPGHGKLLTKDDVRANLFAFRKMNRHMTELVKKRVPKAQATADLKHYLKDIGWDRTVSTDTFLKRSLDRYYDEIAAADSN
jgi:glyoxylase-like metal-dependent hydrolase (beta-lactamase superfamily II)